MNENIDAERQYLVDMENKTFCLDFAIFCKQRNIDIECDGDQFHLEEEAVKRDKKRNNLLESFGWSVLRFTTDEIKKDLKEALKQIKKTINGLGGLQDVRNLRLFRYFDYDSSQLKLF